MTKFGADGSLQKASTLNLVILCKINVFAYYGRAFHYLQLKRKLSLSDQNLTCGLHFCVKVYRMTQQPETD